MTDRYVSVGFFYNAERRLVLLHLRSPDAEVHPGMWSSFGGRSEPEDLGDPVGTWQREVHEELGILLDPAEIRALPGFRPYPGPVGPRHSFFAEWADTSEAFALTEGQALAWFGIDDALALENLSDLARASLTHFREHVLENSSPDC